MSRRARIGALFLGILLLACGGSEPPSHLVLVTFDTLRADHLGSYGYGRETSPNFDALARRGIRFDDAIAQAILTPASHASILTGLNPPAHGLRRMAGEGLSPENATLAEILREAGFATAAFVSGLPLKRSTGLDQGFEVYDDDMSPYGLERRGRRTNSRVRRWLETGPAGRIFVWVHYFDPHLPYWAPEELRRRFVTDPGLKSVPSAIDSKAAPHARPSPELVRGMSELYDAEIAYADAALGELLGILEVGGILEDGVVAVVADHGENLGEGGYYFGHYDVGPAVARIPMLLVHPQGRWRGVVVDELVRSVDLAPTLLSWLGVRVPEGLDGRDLTPLLEGVEDEPRQAYVEQLEISGASGLYSERWLLWSPLGGGARDVRLYDRERDPALEVDLRAERPELAARLASALAAAREPARAHAPIPKEVSHAERERLRALGYLE